MAKHTTTATVDRARGFSVSVTADESRYGNPIAVATIAAAPRSAGPNAWRGELAHGHRIAAMATELGAHTHPEIRRGEVVCVVLEADDDRQLQDALAILVEAVALVDLDRRVAHAYHAYGGMTRRCSGPSESDLIGPLG